MDLPFMYHTCLIFFLTVVTAFPPSPPDFSAAFKESLLIIAREGLHESIDLSAEEDCYSGSVSYGNYSTSSGNESCNTRPTSVVCILTDGSSFANVSLTIHDTCRRDIVAPPASQNFRLYLHLWVPILGVILLGAVIGLVVFTFMKIRQKCKESRNGKSTYQSSYAIPDTRSYSISSTGTEISIISNSPTTSINTLSLTPRSPPCRSDSAFSSMKTLGTIPEDDDSTPDESADRNPESDSCHDLKIVYSRSTTTLSDVVFLDVEDHNESSTDATLEMFKNSKPRASYVSHVISQSGNEMRFFLFNRQMDGSQESCSRKRLSRGATPALETDRGNF